MADEPILDLETLIKRPHIKIDGKHYELLSPDELSVLDSEWFTMKGREISERSNEEDLGTVERLVGEVVQRCVVSLPDDVFEQLSGSQKMVISELFTQLLSHHKTRVTGAIAEAVLTNRKQTKTPTGAKSSLGSSVSSAALQAGGSPKLQAHS